MSLCSETTLQKKKYLESFFSDFSFWIERKTGLYVVSTNAFSMLVLLSPAKTLDESPSTRKDFSQPEFLDHSTELIKTLRKLNHEDIKSLMHISDKLTDLNVQRYQSFTTPFDADNSKSAIDMFQGDVYTGLAAEDFSAADRKFAQKHLRILSGLYGLLKPLDLMMPYRLEMGTKLQNKEGKNLYEFWGDTITNAINSQKPKAIINLASNEYFKAVNHKNLKADVIDIVFRDTKNGKQKIIAFYAKKARGMMARFIIKNRIKKIDDLKGFDTAGYSYDESQSSEKTLVFTRPEQ